jgi:hypothetical protein
MRKPWVERNAGGAAVGLVRLYLRQYGPLTDHQIQAWTVLSSSAVRAARAQLGCVPAGKGGRLGTSGRFPTLWALPKEKRR